MLSRCSEAPFKGVAKDGFGSFSMVSAEIVGWLMSALTRKRPTEVCPEALRPVGPL